MIGYRLVLPTDADWWLELLVGFGIMLLVYLLLRKEGVTYHRRHGR
jgi:hypothetical protein